MTALQGDEKLMPQRARDLAKGAVLTPADIAVLLKMELRTVQRHLKNGAIPGRKFGGSWRSSRASIEALLP